MIGKIAYASCCVYSPAGAGAVCERSRLLRALLKAGDAHRRPCRQPHISTQFANERIAASSRIDGLSAPSRSLCERIDSPTGEFGDGSTYQRWQVAIFGLSFAPFPLSTLRDGPALRIFRTRNWQPNDRRA